MHTKPDLRVVLKWMIAGSGSVIAGVIPLCDGLQQYLAASTVNHVFGFNPSPRKLLESELMATTRDLIARYKKLEHRIVVTLGCYLLLATFVTPFVLYLTHSYSSELVEQTAIDRIQEFVLVSIWPMIIGAGIIIYFIRPKCTHCKSRISRSQLSDDYCGKCGHCFNKTIVVEKKRGITM